MPDAKTFSPRELVIIEEFLSRLSTADASKAKELRAGLRAVGFRIEEMSPATGRYCLADLANDVDEGRIRIRVDV